MFLSAALVTASLCLAQPAAGASIDASIDASIRWEQSGGGFEPGNWAGPAAGAIAFGKDEEGGNYRIANVNDGRFGDFSAWIGKTDNSFVGVRFPRSVRIDRVAFGRDTTSHHRDRCRGRYVVQYTTVSSPNALTPSADWKELFTIDYRRTTIPRPVIYHGAGIFSRNVFQFPPVNATAVRIITTAARDGVLLAIDEIEVYGPDSAHELADAEATAERTRVDEWRREALPGPTGPITKTNLLGDRQYDWLVETAKTIAASVKDRVDDTTVYTPGVYAGFWSRDAYYLVSGIPEAVPPRDLAGMCRLFLDYQKADGRVPQLLKCKPQTKEMAWKIAFAADSAQFLVKLAHEYFQRTGDKKFVEDNLAALKRAMDSIPRDPKGLVWIDPAAPYTGYGFHDVVLKTGVDTYASLLYWETCKELAEMAEATGEKEVSKEMLSRAALIESNLSALWDEPTGMYFAASEIGRKTDVWASAYAVYIGFPSPARNLRIAHYLVDHYDACVWAGQVRHLPSPQLWEKMTIPVRPGEYQNGAYWGTASGWVAYAIAQVDPPLASRMLSDMIDYYRHRGIFECVLPSHYEKYHNYAASIGCPLAAVRKLRGESTSKSNEKPSLSPGLQHAG